MNPAGNKAKRLSSVNHTTKTIIIIIITFSFSRQYLSIFYIPFIYYYCERVLFTLKVFSLLQPLNDTSVDVDGSFQFSSKAEFILPLHAHITFAIDTEAESALFAQLLILLPFFRSLWGTKHDMNFQEPQSVYFLEKYDEQWRLLAKIEVFNKKDNPNRFILFLT